MSKAIHSSRGPQFPLPFSHAVHAGEFVYVSGQVGVHPETLELAGDTVEEQLAQCFRNIETILGETGLTLDHVVKVNAFVTDPRDIPAYNRAYEQSVGKPFPARTTVVSDLGKYRVEVDVVAYTGNVRHS
ncbi:RidA family protein [Paenibacillaceae bacterium WGS1546]|uniref:RidA family protein n=1 Tax=Cohnella sp. WGS1546 TaxID=3366810 RepID=UPI00372D6016